MKIYTEKEVQEEKRKNNFNKKSNKRLQSSWTLA
jgi:hypothetical protein